MVSIYSLNAAYANKPSSKSDIIVLLPESIEFRYQDIESLEKLGARIVRVNYLIMFYCTIQSGLSNSFIRLHFHNSLTRRTPMFVMTL